MGDEGKRMLGEMFRDPDEDFSARLRAAALLAPLALGMLATMLFIAVVVANRATADGSALAAFVNGAVRPLMKLIAWSILPVFIFLKILHIYVRVKVARSRKEAE